MIRTLNLSTALCLAAAVLVPFKASAQQPASDLTKEEQALCRSDAIRLCFFKISDANAQRGCLRTSPTSRRPAAG
jgi:hypothetical protein